MRRIPLLALLLACSATVGLCAQSFDLVNGRLPITSLDGLWRFHAGDNMAWADPKFDDSQWALVRSDENLGYQGYQGLSGMAWFRFQVTIPAGLDQVSLRLPRILTCYEVYANGALIGSFGKMPPNTRPYNSGEAFSAYALPPGNGSARKIEIALRVWNWAGWPKIMSLGPLYGGGLVGDSGEIDYRMTLSREENYWLSSSVEILALLQTLAGLGVLALFALRRSEREYLWFSLSMLLSAGDNWLLICFRTQVWNLHSYAIVASVFQSGSSLALIVFLQALLRTRRTFLLKMAAASVAMVPLLRILWTLLGPAMSVSLMSLLEAILQLPLNIWMIVAVLVKARQGSVDARLLAVPAILNGGASIFTYGAAVTSELGWQMRFQGAVFVTQTPFPIHLQQVSDTLFLLSVCAILILRFTRARSEEERYAGEVQAARSVQEYLIPEQLPPTPGLAIESVYRPALEVGGDFFQVIPDPADDSVLIVVGDVAGHGMESGMLATLIVGGIRMAAFFTTDPERVLALLNRRMRGRGLATCLALRIERDGSATLANAGHLPPYFNGKELEMEGALPLGAVPGITFPLLHFKLAESDSLMLMTDGVAEAQDAEGRLFGFERIGEMLRAGVAAGALASAAQAFGQEDDITVLMVTRGAVRSHQPQRVHIDDEIAAGDGGGVGVG